ncbi:unnamed protein product, partial [Tetraodon nigroviridis]
FSHNVLDGPSPSAILAASFMAHYSPTGRPTRGPPLPRVAAGLPAGQRHDGLGGLAGRGVGLVPVSRREADGQP